MEYKIKELSLQDLDVLINKYIIYYNGEGGKWTYDLAKRSLEQTFLTPYFYGIGMYDGSELLGITMGCFKQYDDILLYYLDEILLFKEYQNKGLGTKLFQELELLVKEHGAERINLSTTYEENHQRFYTRLGFKKSDFLVTMVKKI